MEITYFYRFATGFGSSSECFSLSLSEFKFSFNEISSLDRDILIDSKWKIVCQDVHTHTHSAATGRDRERKRVATDLWLVVFTRDTLHMK